MTSSWFYGITEIREKLHYKLLWKSMAFRLQHKLPVVIVHFRQTAARHTHGTFGSPSGGPTQLIAIHICVGRSNCKRIRVNLETHRVLLRIYTLDKLIAIYSNVKTDQSYQSMPIYTVHKVKNVYYFCNDAKKWYKQQVRFALDDME